MQRSWRRHIFPLSALILLLSAAPAAAAEIDEGTWEFGVFGAYTIYDNESTIDDGVSYGGRAGYYFRPADGVELDLTFGSADDNTRGSTRSYDIARYFINYVHNFQLKKETRLRPMLVAGLGRFRIDDGHDDANTTTLQFGGGARVSLSPHADLRFDGTMFHWRGHGRVIPPAGYFSFEVTAGVSFFFGSGS